MDTKRISLGEISHMFGGVSLRILRRLCEQQVIPGKRFPALGKWFVVEKDLPEVAKVLEAAGFSRETVTR